jgi:hypothetical protein
MYDSTQDTLKHIETVQKLLFVVSRKLHALALKHDKSKLEAPEKPIFDEYTPKLKDSTYLSDEYKTYLKEMKVGLDHHYAENRHHPEHFPNGINDMTLIDLIEMFVDWLAATKRHNDGDINRSIKVNKDRFEYDNQLESILNNTARMFEHIDLVESAIGYYNCNIEEVREEAREIVYDGYFGICIESDEYKNKCDANNFKIAHHIIMELVSMGLG